MKLKLCTVLLATAAIFAPLTSVAQQAQDAGAKRNAVEKYGKLPLSFEPTENAGRYLARSGRYAVSVGAGESSVSVTDPKSGRHQRLRFAFENASSAVRLEALEPQTGVINYYVGRDPAKWRLGVKSFAKLRAPGVYPGVDVVYYGDQRRLEFDFVVAPQADPSVIALAFSGADKFYKDGSGDLVAELAGQSVHFVKPYAYQKAGGVSKAVAADYELAADGKVRLHLGDYDRNAELIVDPVVSYATYLGGNMYDAGNGIAVDSSGNAYVTGQTCSSDFPDSPNPSGLLFASSSACDAYIAKYNAAGTGFEYITILGGDNPVNASASGNGIALDYPPVATPPTPPGVYITGTTNIKDLPIGTTQAPLTGLNAYQGGDSDAFIAILNSDGTLLRTSYLGGSGADAGYSIAVDRTYPGANVTVVGQTCSADFPFYNAFETMVEDCVAFVTKLDNALDIGWPYNAFGYIGASALSPPPPNGKTYFFSEPYGGQPVAPFPTAGTWKPGHLYSLGAIVLDTLGHVQVTFTGGTSGPYLPSDVPPVPNWSGIVPATTLDGPLISVNGVPQPGEYAGIPITWTNYGSPAIPPVAFSEAYGVTIDPIGDVILAGGTNTGSLASTLWPCHAGGSGAWVMKVLGTNGGCAYEWTLESTATDATAKIDTARAVAVDSRGYSYVTGTMSGGLGGTSGTSYQKGKNGTTNAFVFSLNQLGSAVNYSTYLGGSGADQGLGITVDANFSAYVTGGASSMDFPVINPLTNPNTNDPLRLSGSENAFVSKLSPNGSALIFSSYMGGSSADQGNAIAVAPDLNPANAGKGYFDMYVAGNTTSTDFESSLNCVATPPPSSGCTVTYAPPQAANNGNGDAFVAMIPGSGIPTVTVTPGSLAFGNWNVGTTSTPLAVTYTNTNTISPVQINSTGGIVFSNPEFQQIPGDGAPGTPPDCAPGLVVPANNPLVPNSGTCQILVVFTPQAQTLQNGTLSIADDAGSAPHVINLTGEGAVPTDTFAPANLTFPLSPLTAQGVGNQSALQSVTLTNTSGTGTLFVQSIARSGLNPGDFSESDDCQPSVSPSNLTVNPPVWSTCTINVNFTPTAAGPRSASLLVTDNASATPQQIPLAGTGRLVASTVTTTPASNPLSLSFPQQGTNVASTNPLTVTVTNTDLTQNLLVNVPVITGDYQLGTDTCAGSGFLLPGVSCFVQVYFYPLAPGTRNGTLTIGGNGTALNPPASIALTGTAGASTTLQPAALSFSGTNLGVTSPVQPVTLTNTSSFPFSVQSIAISGPAAGDFSQTNTCGTSVSGTPAAPPAVANCMIGVSFTPTVTGNRNATLTIISGATASPQSVSIVGIGTAPLVALSQASVGTCPVNPGVTPCFTSEALSVSSAPVAIKVTNNGTGPLNIPAGGITIAGTAAGDFSQTNNCGTQVAAGAFCTVNVTFTPSALNSRTATLNIADNAIPGPQTVALLGTGVQVQVPTISGLSFLNQPLNQASGVKTVTITNNDPNSYVLSLGVPAISGDFQLVAASTTCSMLPAGTLLAKGSNCVIGVTFTPTASGTRTGSLTVSSNSSSAPLTATLTGIGGAAATLSPNPATLNLGSTNLSQSSTPLSVKLTNTSIFPVNITSVAMSGAGANEFVATNNCGTIVSGTSAPPPAVPNCTISVIFTPTAVGSQTATMTINSDAATPFPPVALSGTGTDLTVVLSPASVGTCPANPGVTPCFTSEALSVSSTPVAITLTNNGTGPLNIPAGGITIAGTAAGDFSQTNNCGTQVAALPGVNTCKINVTFTPSALNSRTASLNIADNAIPSLQTVALLGTGVQVLAPTISGLPVNFLNQQLNQVSAVKTVTIANNDPNGYVLSLGVPTITGDFQLVAASTTCSMLPGGTLLAKNSSCQIGVTFTPTASGTRNGSLTVSSNSSSTPLTVPLTGIGGASASLSPNTLTLASTNLSQSSAAQSVTLKNASSFVVNISSVAMSGAGANEFVATNDCGTIVPAAVSGVPGSCTVSVIFSPTAIGIQTATMTINSDAGTPFAPVALSGTGTAWTVTLVPATSLTFTGQPLNSASTASPIALTNNGAGPLNIAAGGITITGTAAGDFSQTNNCGTQVAAGATCTINVTFTPLAQYSRTATLNIADNAIPSPQTIALLGTGVQVQAPTISGLPVSFVNQPLNQASTTVKTVTITNSDPSYALTLGIPAITGDFQLVPASTTCSMLSPGTVLAAKVGSCVIGVTFTPTAPGARTGLLTVSSNSSNIPLTVPLTGIGGASASLSPNTLNLGSTNLTASSVAQSVTLTNSSKFAVNISSVTMSGAGANEFIATNNCGTIVPGTAAPAPAVPNCTVSVTFAPTATGIQTATMNINSDAATPFSPVALSGTGTTPTVSLSPTSASFPNQALNVASSPVAITLTNTGTGSLNFQQVGGITITGPAAGDFSQTNNCGQQVAAGTTGNSCIVNIVFTPSALNSRIAALVFYDDALNTPQTVTLSGTGTAGSGVIQLLPTPLAFGNQQVATTVTLPVTLTNTSSTSALAISTIVISGNTDFTLAPPNNCPASLAKNTACMIGVTFTPSAAVGTETATVTVTGSASNSPQKLTVTGTGTTGPSGPSNFTVTPTDNGGQSVTQGGQATFTLSVAPQNNFKETITFTCAGPVGSTCSVSPNPLTMDGTTVPTLKVYVNTSGGNGGSAKLTAPRLGSRSIFLALLPFSLVGILFINKRRCTWLVFMLLAVCLLMGLASCGTGTASSSSNSGPLSPGTYQVTLTGTANGATPVNVALTLVVNKQ